MSFESCQLHPPRVVIRLLGTGQAYHEEMIKRHVAKYVVKPVRSLHFGGLSEGKVEGVLGREIG